jgi:branched-chain amino acid transport system substrate-binding protein
MVLKQRLLTTFGRQRLNAVTVIGKTMNVAQFQSHDVRIELLEKAATHGATKLGVTANIAAHTNELIGGVVLAVQDVGFPVDIVWRDDRRDAETARKVAQSLIEEGVVAVVGHLSASAALPASGIYADAGVVFVAPGTTHPALMESGRNCIFRVCGRDDEQAKLMADFIAWLPRHQLTGIIEQDIPYGQKLANLLRDALMDRGLSYVTFPCGNEGLNFAALDQFAKTRIDALVIAGIHEIAAVCCRQLGPMGHIKPVLLGDDGFTPNLLALAGTSVVGANVVAPGPAHNRDAKIAELVKRYRGLLCVEPGAYFLTSYAATWILLNALSAGNTHRRNSLADCLHDRVWETPAGCLKFDEKGEAQGLGWTIYQIEDDRFVPRRHFNAFDRPRNVAK